MTEQELDQVLFVREMIEEEVTRLVTAMLDPTKLTPKQDELIRMQLTENYRFWKN